MTEAYQKLNDGCARKIIFNVGTGAGFYSELGAMLECMLYCFHNGIAFTLYADGANFANTAGWNEFFVPFCNFSHDHLNKSANYRYRYHYRWRGQLFPNLFFRKFALPFWLKRRSGASLLTQDVFHKFTSPDFKQVNIHWPELGVNGRVGDIYSQLRLFAMRLNTPSLEEVEAQIRTVGLPKNYTSIQIRSGDKAEEFDQLIDVDYCLEKIEEMGVIITDLFVFTDDYTNIQKLRIARPNWNIFTLTGEDERGYYNDAFYKQDWPYRRRNLIKLFSMVEICINSDLHIGYFGACVSAFIGAAKPQGTYFELRRGVHKKRSLSAYAMSLISDALRKYDRP